MSNYNLAGDFDFNSTNINSSEGFCAYLRINVPATTYEQHIYIKEELAEILSMRPHSVPTAWGKGPINYDEINFDTNVFDSTRTNGLRSGDLSLVKHLIGLLKEGRKDGVIDDREGLKANGQRYPDNGDHPLFAKIPPLNNVSDALRDFKSLDKTIRRVIDEANERFPSSAPEKPKLPKQDPDGLVL